MKPTTTLAALAVLAHLTSAARAQEAEEACGTQTLSDEALAELEHAADVEMDDKADDATVFHVPVYLHVIRKAPQGEGDMPVAHARAITIDVLNETFAAQKIPFVFELKKIDYTNAADATYHLAQNSSEEKALWDSLQVKGLRNLNIYIVGPHETTNETGWAEFLVNPAIRRGDHAVLRYYPTRGGFSDPLVPVHEAGHWLGLLHTFHFGCGGILRGDLIGDTPQQKQTHSCAAHTDTCPDDSGEDALANIMGYSNACRAEFSAGQIKRMKFLYRTLRGGKGDDLPPPDETGESEDETTGGCNAAPSGGAGSALALLLAIASALIRRGRSKRATS